jgi:hypothetical protein
VSVASSNAESLVAVGEFDVKIGAPDMIPVPTGASAVGRHALEKEYHGGLKGHAFGEMLTAGQPQLGEATYVALESFSGTLNGRVGGFALAHLGQMSAGSEELRISIAPGSGTGELAGIRGELLIRRESGTHHYTLNYRIG